MKRGRRVISSRGNVHAARFPYCLSIILAEGAAGASSASAEMRAVSAFFRVFGWTDNTENYSLSLLILPPACRRDNEQLF